MQGARSSLEPGLTPTTQPAPQHGPCAPSCSTLGSLKQVTAPVELVHCQHPTRAAAHHTQDLSCPQRWPIRTCPYFGTSLFAAAQHPPGVINPLPLCSTGIPLCAGAKHTNVGAGGTHKPTWVLPPRSSPWVHNTGATGCLPTQQEGLHPETWCAGFLLSHQQGLLDHRAGGGSEWAASHPEHSRTRVSMQGCEQAEHRAGSLCNSRTPNP